MQLSKIANILTDVLLPPLCLSCGEEGVYLCESCRAGIDAYKYFVCPICKRRSIDGRLDAGCRKESGLTRYLGAPLPHSHELVKKLIHSLKYRHARELAAPLSQILIEFLEKNSFGEVTPGQTQNSRVIMVPVPLYNFRERERGFNQASEIAKYIGEYYGIPVEEKVLSKQKNTPRQVDILKKEERQKNLTGAFSCLRPEIIENKTAILVDDVYTTGTTMYECARVLRTAGARQVWGMTVARG